MTPWMKDWLWLPIVAAVALVLVVALAKAIFRPRIPASPYRRKRSLFTRDERRFYDALRAATGGRYIIFAQMRLIDLIEIPRGQPGSQYWYPKIRHKHVDFVLCDPTTAEPVLAIELDGESHQSDLQQKRDAEKDAVLAQAGLFLLRIPTQKTGYTTKWLATELAKALPPAGDRNRALPV